jgi:Fur family ferric uptake transcriptional regulator
MTKARKAVLEILDGASAPLCAQEIESLTESVCDPATIYRALHFLEEKGFAESFVLHCDAHGTERYYVSRRAPHRHWFHCERCHRFVDLGACKVDPILREMAAATGVEIRSHTLYATGICGACRGAPSSGTPPLSEPSSGAPQ